MALFGVLIINILSDFRVPLLESIQTPFADSHWTNLAVEFLAAGSLEFKALTIFSFLFGVGIAIQVERTGARKISAIYFLSKRFLWLFVLGTAHLLFIWNGDVLALYSICGLLLLPLARLSSTSLFLIGCAIMAFPAFVSLGVEIPSGRAASNLIEQARQIYGHQGYRSILEFRWHETRALIVPLLVMTIPRTIGLMCWGIAGWRSGILLAPEQQRKKMIFTLIIGGLVGGAITASNIWAELFGSSFWQVLQNIYLDPSILVAAAYVSGLLLWLAPSRTSRLSALAALGQTALTNYVIQSIVLGFIFYGYGLGLFGRLGAAAAAGVGVAIYVVQAGLSRVWLQHFQFGPLEWLWRSLSYGRCQPMRFQRKSALPGS